MKIAIDSYCYHRYFGEVYAGLETAPSSRMTMLDFVDKAKAFDVEGVSLESCFLPDPGKEELRELRTALDRHELMVVWAWGHPGGLGSGNRPEQLADLKKHTVIAGRLGAKTMRICCGGRRTRIEDWPTHRAKLLPLLREAVDHARTQGVVLAIENHIDFLADELVDLVLSINSPWLGVCLDTANNLRMLEDPMVAIRKLAPFAKATHIKDVAARSGHPREFAFWPSVALGDGLIDLPATFDCLRAYHFDGLLALEIDYLYPSRYCSEDEAVQKSIGFMKKALRI